VTAKQEDNLVGASISDSSLPELPKELYWKTFTCPLTGADFPAVSVKRNAYSLRGRDPDFAPRYDGINPLWYGVITSPSGFAAEESIYKRSPKLLFKDREGLEAQIRNQPQSASLILVRDLPEACRTYSVALGLTAFLKMSRYMVAGLAMRASWVFREWFEDGNTAARDQIYALRKIALEHYKLAYEKEDTSRLKLGSAGVGYLIAELYREQGQFDESLKWFGRIIHDKTAAGEVLRQARDRMDLCREQRQKAKETGQYEKPETERFKERAMYQLYRDQARWMTKHGGATPMGESGTMRGIVDGIINSNTDLSAFQSEEELAEWLAKKLGSDN